MEAHTLASGKQTSRSPSGWARRRRCPGRCPYCPGQRRTALFERAETTRYPLPGPGAARSLWGTGGGGHLTPPREAEFTAIRTHPPAAWQVWGGYYSGKAA